MACSCEFIPLDQIYADSTDVFLAQVIAVRRVTEQPEYSHHADYVATFRVTHVYKGDPEIEFELPFESRYYEPDPREPVQEIIVVAGCKNDIVVDQTFLILRNGSETIETHWCSSRLHAAYRVDFQFLEELAARYQ